MSIDDRLREGLRATNQVLPTPDTQQALTDVTHGAGPTDTRRRTLLTVAAAAATVATIIALTDQVGERGTAPPVAPSPTPGPTAAASDTFYFTADSRAGDALDGPLSQRDAEVDPQHGDIYLKVDGQPVRRVIASEAYERCPTTSPAGDRLAYLEDATIVVVSLAADGAPGRPAARIELTPGAEFQPRRDAGITCPQWSPDGRRLAYVAKPDGAGSSGETVDAEIREVTIGGPDRLVQSFTNTPWRDPVLAWSPDGTTLAYSTPEGLWRQDVDGGGSTQLWAAPQVETGTDPMSRDSVSSVSWSVENEIAFSVRRMVPSGSSMWSHTSTLYMVEADGGAAQTLDAMHLYDAGPGWSPDGRSLAFIGADGFLRINDRTTGTTSRLSTVLEDGTRPELWDVSWAPDGQELVALARTDERGFTLARRAVTGSDATTSTPWTWAFDLVGQDLSWRAAPAAYLSRLTPGTYRSDPIAFADVEAALLAVDDPDVAQWIAPLRQVWGTMDGPVVLTVEEDSIHVDVLDSDGVALSRSDNPLATRRPYLLTDLNGGDTLRVQSPDREAEWEAALQPASDPSVDRFVLTAWMRPQADVCPEGCAVATIEDVPHDVLCQALLGTAPFTRVEPSTQ